MRSWGGGVATETLALGVNLPARTVVIDSVMRGRGDTLTGADFAQLAGRAGRRGLDAVGYVVVPWAHHVALADVAGLRSALADARRGLPVAAIPTVVAELRPLLRDVRAEYRP